MALRLHMSEEYTYSDWRGVQSAEQQIRETPDQEQSVPAGFEERAKHQSYSQTYEERIAGVLMSEQEVWDWLNDSDDTPTNLSTESLIDWVSREEAKKVRAYRKHRDRWRRLFDEDVVREKRQDVARILAKAKRRIANET